MKPEMNDAPKPPVDVDRLRSFSDNIYAFSMTILVTELRLPVLTEREVSMRLFSVLSYDWRFFAFYMISFLTIGSYWLLHQTIYTHVVKTDRAFIWLNLLLLLSVTFLPFPTALMGKYGRNPDTAFIYGAIISCSYLLLNLTARYARRHQLLLPELPYRMVRLFQIKLLISLVFALAGTLLAFYYMRLAFLFYALMTLANITPWQRFLQQRATSTKTCEKDYR